MKINLTQPYLEDAESKDAESNSLDLALIFVAFGKVVKSTI